MARKRNVVKLNPVLFIACEGTSTEFEYFKSWAEQDKTKYLFQAVNVYPNSGEKKPKTNPHQLIEIARQELENGSANIAWVVFDKDGHPLLDETFTKARAANINIAFSSRSFEEWVLLHFEKNNFPFQASECKTIGSRTLNCGTPAVPACATIPCLAGHLRRSGYITDYSKKRDFDLFQIIHERTDIAIVNAAWSRSRRNASINRIQPSLVTLNPYTDVDILVSLFLHRDEKIEWGIANAVIILHSWSILATLNNGIITLQLSHTLPQSQIINANFDNQSFFTTDDALNDVPCVIRGKRLTVNRNGSSRVILVHDDRIEYSFQHTGQPYFLFKPNGSSIKVYIVL